ncbi:hypothetical protein SH668x_001271 [Planctomicrobium sp. SH668]|uniref:hypothetical protein n=1 Tax=Planctomicrobium sp. SH668 TaxID=3448126 RepID=UPI003F5C26CA
MSTLATTAEIGLSLTRSTATRSRRRRRCGKRINDRFETPTLQISMIDDGNVQVTMPLLAFLKLMRETTTEFDLEVSGSISLS